MVKSPVEYLLDQDFSMGPENNREISTAERLFFKKYLGVDDPGVLRDLSRHMEGGIDALLKLAPHQVVENIQAIQAVPTLAMEAAESSPTEKLLEILDLPLEPVEQTWGEPEAQPEQEADFDLAGMVEPEAEIEAKPEAHEAQIAPEFEAVPVPEAGQPEPSLIPEGQDQIEAIEEQAQMLAKVAQHMEKLADEVIEQSQEVLEQSLLPSSECEVPVVEVTPVDPLAPVKTQKAEKSENSDSHAGDGKQRKAVSEHLANWEEEVESYSSLDVALREMPALSLVGFYVCSQRFVIPLDAVQEVIRYQPPYRLPMAPSYVPGVINLRGQVTPVVRLADLLLLPKDRKPHGTDSLYIICHCQGLQIGLQIDKTDTMYRVEQDKLTWNAETHLGSSAEFLSGLLEVSERLFGIISVERIVDTLLGA